VHLLRGGEVGDLEACVAGRAATERRPNVECRDPAFAACSNTERTTTRFQRPAMEPSVMK
jgi:hypothetical protein